MEVSLNSWTIIFLIGSAQGLFQAVLIFFSKKGDRLSNQLLSGVVFGFSLILLYCVAYWTNYVNSLPRYFSLLLGLTYIIGPLMWLYALRQKKLQLPTRVLLHFIPFIFHFVMIIASGVWLSEHLRTVSFGLVIVQNIHLLIYAGMVLKLLNSGVQRNWQRNISFAYLGYALSFFSYYVMSWAGVLQIEYDYMVSFAMMGFIYFVGYHSYMHQEAKSPNGKKYNKSSLTPKASLAVFEKLRANFENEELYLNNEVTLKSVASELEISTHVVSQVVNEHTGGNFPDFVNSYRIRYAMELMKQPAYQNEKLMAIAYDVGFNNKVSFINAFKKYNNSTPNEYRKTLKMFPNVRLVS